MKDIFSGAVGMCAADAATGGLARKLSDTLIRGAANHAGTIGKVASGLGEKIFSQSFRNKISGVADKALQYIPDGNVKTASTRINI